MKKLKLLEILLLKKIKQLIEISLFYLVKILLKLMIKK